MKNKFINLYNLIMEDLEKSSISDDQLKKLDDHVGQLSANITNDKELKTLKFDNNTKDKIENVILRDSSLSKEITAYDSILNLGDFSRSIIDLSDRYPVSYKILMKYLDYRDDETNNIGIEFKSGIYNDPIGMLIANMKNGLESNKKFDEAKMREFLEKIAGITVNKNGAASGSGELFLALFFRKGSLAVKKGDVKIGNDLLEVKGIDAAIGVPSSSHSESKDAFRKYFIENNKFKLNENERQYIESFSWTLKAVILKPLFNNLKGFLELSENDKLSFVTGFLKLFCSKCVFISDSENVNDLFKDETFNVDWFNFNKNMPIFNVGYDERFREFLVKLTFDQYQKDMKFSYFGFFSIKDNYLKIVPFSSTNFYKEFSFNYPSFSYRHNMVRVIGPFGKSFVRYAKSKK